MTDHDSYGDLHTFVTTTHGLNRDDNDKFTDKQRTNNVIEDDIQYSSNIVETESTTVVEDSVQEPKRATSTESVEVQTAATVNIVTDNNGNVIK